MTRLLLKIWGILCVTTLLAEDRFNKTEYLPKTTAAIGIH
jgi:hypothetical protein